MQVVTYYIVPETEGPPPEMEDDSEAEASQDKRLRLSKAVQQEEAKRFRAANGMTGARSFTETYKPGMKEWPTLEKALDYCREAGLPLIIAQLARLRQNPTLMAVLAQSGVEFVAIDDPQVNSNTASMLAAFAQEQAVKRSQATKEGLTRARSQGKPLGGAITGRWNGPIENMGWKAAAEKREQQADDFYQFVLPRAAQMRRDGAMYTEIAEALNRDGFTTQSGQPFKECSISRLLDRARKKGLLPERVNTSAQNRERAANDYYKGVLPLIAQMRQEGSTFQEIADTLNRNGYTNKLGKPYTVCTLHRLFERAKERGLVHV